jgi:predicted metalloprotease with PDZ domain
MRRNRFLTSLSGAVFCALFIYGTLAYGAVAPQVSVNYTVKVANIEQQLLHVTTSIENIRQPYVDLSLPTWIPGLYKANDYAMNIIRLQISDAKGNRAVRRMIDRQTWRVETKGIDRLTVEFDYRADKLAIDQAKLSKDFAFFTGIQLFLKVEGHSNRESRVKLEVPEGWKIVSALKDTADPTTFVAANYDILVDAPTIAGKFDLKQFEVNGKPHYLVTAPAGASSPADIDKAATTMAKDIATQGAIFGDWPYDKYVYFFFTSQPDWTDERSIACLNSQIMFLPPNMSVISSYSSYVSSHEFFHLWNGKRIQPRDSWTLNYSHISTTPLLWMTEGFTNYFARLSRYRAGIDSRERFIFGLGESVQGVRTEAARTYISPADSSVFTWADYASLGPIRPFKTSVLGQGEIIALMLDMMIRRDSGGSAGLEDVMRVLYADYFKKGKGYTTEDLISIMSRLGKRDYTSFFNKYVWGVENMPIEEALAQAGYQYEEYSIQIPSLGFRMEQTPEGPKVNAVAPGSESDKAGLLAGDLVTALDDINVDFRMAGVRERLSPKIGQFVKLNIKRGGEAKVLNVKVGFREEMKRAITEVEKVTPEQLKMRELWLKKSIVAST